MSNIKLITNLLIDEIITAIERSSSIYILTSFVMKSGVELLQQPLKRAVDRGAEIKICAGDYLYVTQPEALKLLIELDERIEVRLWRSNGRSFHPKAYIFQYQENEGSLIIGSSNLSRSALTSGVEWNLALESWVAKDTFQEALDQFMKLFLADETIPVNKETLLSYEKSFEKYHQENPNLVRIWTKNEEINLMLVQSKDDKKEADRVKDKENHYNAIIPRPSQEEALKALETVVEEGYDKAMVVMATGLGKTYLAGFFAKRFQRILFVAHREEILHQAKRSFENIMPERTHGIFNGREKMRDADCVFASIYTLANQQHLHNFQPDTFDLIVIDEFHHAAAKSYQKVVNYFKPKFLLGITATPDRMDGKDVYGICDGNVAYQINFIEAIQRQWLTPFHYIGVYDETDYSKITWLGTRYDEEELLAVQLQEQMAAKIFESWKKYKQTRTLAFCSSIRQAEFLTNYFKNQGIKATSLHSGICEYSRPEAIRRIEKGELEVIFTVDLFNEGVDIPSIDTLLFVRPTESLTIFTQQVGRGLRLYQGKEVCMIIDLIGNYRNADVKLSLFDTRTDEEREKKRTLIPQVPENCVIDFELEVIHLLDELQKKKQPRKDFLRTSYFNLKEELGRRPTYLELHLYGKAMSSGYRQEFKTFVGFLYWADELDEYEKDVFIRYEKWLREVESTGMAKSYKMVVLSYMLSRGIENWLKPVTPEEVAPYFHHFYMEKEYRKKIDFSDKNTKALWDYNEAKVAKLIAKMPMTKWSGSSNGLLSFQNGVFKPEFEVAKEHQEKLYQWTKEICEFRLHAYFERKEKSAS